MHQRGWTLQELLAPEQVHFHNSAWGFIGDKFTFAQQLASITTIDEDVIAGKQTLNSISIARKLSWALSRKTSRVEDKAYCLLGLFSVNMPLLYGEGRVAFRRLCEELLRKTNDPSIFDHDNFHKTMFPLINSQFSRAKGAQHSLLRKLCDSFLKHTWLPRPRYSMFADKLLVENVVSLRIMQGEATGYWGKSLVRISLVLLPSILYDRISFLVLVRDDLWSPQGPWSRCGESDVQKILTIAVSQAPTGGNLQQPRLEALSNTETFLVADHPSPFNYMDDISCSWVDVRSPAWKYIPHGQHLLDSTNKDDPNGFEKDDFDAENKRNNIMLAISEELGLSC